MTTTNEALVARAREIVSRLYQNLRDHDYAGAIRAGKWDGTTEVQAALAALRETAASPTGGAFQARVQPWMMACFGPTISADITERCDRFIEEAFELVQSLGYDPGRIVSLASYVFNRPVGEPAQEVGGVMVTLAALCLATDMDMHAAGETELARIWTKVEAIRAKQAAKPTGSALPVAVPAGDQRTLRGGSSQPLPCPFCASPAKRIEPMGEYVGKRHGKDGGSYAPNGVRYVCSANDCSGCGRACYGENMEAEALAAWNTRALADQSAPSDKQGEDGATRLPISPERTLDDIQRDQLARAKRTFPLGGDRD